MDKSRTASKRRFGALGILGASLFAIAVIVQPLYRTDREFSDPFSAYAVGPYGWVQTAAFVALSLGSFALVVGLQRRRTEVGAWQTGRVLMAAWATGVLLAAIFPIKADVSAPIHMLASMLSFLAIVTANVRLIERVRAGCQVGVVWW